MSVQVPRGGGVLGQSEVHADLHVIQVIVHGPTVPIEYTCTSQMASRLSACIAIDLTRTTH